MLDLSAAGKLEFNALLNALKRWQMMTAESGSIELLSNLVVAGLIGQLLQIGF